MEYDFIRKELPRRKGGEAVAETKYERFLREENETKPNRYSANTMLLVGVILIILWVINAVGLFRVNHVLMTRCSVMELVVVIAIQILGRHPKLRQRPATKYYIILCVLLIALIAYTCLNFHVSLSVMFPLLLAGQYHNRRISWLAFGGSVVICFAAPVLGNLLHTWDQDYLMVMLEISGLAITGTEPAALPASAPVNIIQILFYVGLPCASIVCGFSPIMFSVARTGRENIESRINVMKLSETDQLTGALNRNCFETARELYPRLCRDSLACVYCDVNGLHELNNTLGHAAGDAMLKFVVTVLQDTFGREDTYRIGGDEFVCLVRDVTPEELDARVSKVRLRLSAEGYHMSIGISRHNFDENVRVLISAAEREMYRNKKEFYESGGARRGTYRD